MYRLTTIYFVTGRQTDRQTTCSMMIADHTATIS